MSKIVLLSCSSRKKNYTCRAEELYSESSNFRLAYEYAKLVADQIYILSTKYGLLHCHDVIAPYNSYLGDKTEAEQISWAHQIVEQLSSCTDINNDTYEILAGKLYYGNIIHSLSHYNLPLQHIRLGDWPSEIERLIRLTRQPDLNEVSAEQIHIYVNSMPRYSYESLASIPFRNGIYIMFEQGESLYGVDRIVRVGTHVSEGRLVNRLVDHFNKEDKNGSIFRKNIGRALLNQRNDTYIRIWNLDTRKQDVYLAYKESINAEKESQLEREITEYIRKNITFTCIGANTEQDRLRFEEGLISALNHDPTFKPSLRWLGLSSPVDDIVKCGMWLRQGLDAAPITQFEYECLTNQQRIMNPNSVIVQNPIREKQLVSSFGIPDIKLYIKDLLDKRKAVGETSTEIVSGEIHKAMGLSNKMPSVCAAMYQLMGNNDIVLHTTPSGKSSTIKISYIL